MEEGSLRSEIRDTECNFMQIPGHSHVTGGCSSTKDACCVADACLLRNPQGEQDVPHCALVFVGATHELPEEWVEFFEFLAEYGLRFGEAVELRWKDVETNDLGGLLHVRRRWYRGRVASPKAGSSRVLRLEAGRARALEARRGIQPMSIVGRVAYLKDEFGAPTWYR